jgi:hypothetical protein
MSQPFDSLCLHFQDVTVTISRCHCHNFKVSLSQFQRVTVTISRCHCHDFKVSLSRFQGVTVTISTCHCHNFKVSLSQFQRVTVTILTSSLHTLFTFIPLLPEGRAGEAREPSNYLMLSLSSHTVFAWDSHFLSVIIEAVREAVIKHKDNFRIHLLNEPLCS